ncbi:MAG: TolC family protein [Ignavibacteria bacterium]|nr:TolC family protein [Ignavibacteria bacterium]
MKTFNKDNNYSRIYVMKRYCLIVTILASALPCSSQQVFSLKQAIETALKSNSGLKASFYETEAQRALLKTAVDLPKTFVSLVYGQYNSFVREDNNLTISQTIPFTAFGSQGTLNSSLLESSELKKKAIENELAFNVKRVYFQLAFLQAKQNLLMQQDSIYEGFRKSASLRYTTGESNLLERTTAATQLNEVRNQLASNQADLAAVRAQLQVLLNSNVLPSADQSEWKELSFTIISDSAALQSNPAIAFMQKQTEVESNRKALEIAKTGPDISLGYFNQTLIGTIDRSSGRLAKTGDRFVGFQVGLAVPLWFVPHQGRIQAAELTRQAAQSSYEYYSQTLRGVFQQAFQSYTKNKNSLDYYKTSALPNADLLLKQAEAAFRNGDIGYAEYLIALQKAIAIREGHLQTLSDYNQSVVFIEFLSGTK